MRWSFRIARIAGIDLNIHLTFLLMLPFGAMLWGGTGGVTGAFFGMLMIVLLFACVILHEFGHALAARAFGIPVREIQLLPIGGVAVMGRPVLNPAQELIIALMGPAVNVLLVLGLAVVGVASGLFLRLTPETAVAVLGQPSFDGALLWLIQANMLLALFNMLPAFPLDGGRVTRAMLAFVIGHRRATVIASVIGQGLAVLLGLWGLFSLNFLLIASAIFIFAGARQEVAATEAADVLGALRVDDALTEAPASLQVGQRVREAADLLLASRQQALVVLQGDRPLGVVTRSDVQAALAAGKGDVWVTMAMRRVELVRVEPGDSLDAARLAMAEHNTPILGVFEGERFRGLLTIDDIAAAFALRNGRPPQGPNPEATPAP